MACVNDPLNVSLLIRECWAAWRATSVSFLIDTVNPESFARVYAQVTHSRIGRRISYGYDPASFVTIRIGP